MTSCLRNALEFPLKTQGNYSLISQHRLHERQEHIQAGNTAFFFFFLNKYIFTNLVLLTMQQAIIIAITCVKKPDVIKCVDTS